MKIEIDTHAHTLVSGHAYNTIREMAQMAAEKGLKGLALTEHAPAMPGSTNPVSYTHLIRADIEKYVKYRNQHRNYLPSVYKEDVFSLYAEGIFLLPECVKLFL